MHTENELHQHEKDFHVYCLESDFQAGLIPSFARRGLTPEELDARVNFLAIENESESNATEIAAMLTAARTVLFQLINNDLEQQSSTRAAIERAQELVIKGLNEVDGVAHLVTETANDYRQQLERSAFSAASRVQKEASAQGVGLNELETLDEFTSQELDQQANRLAVLPMTDALRAITEDIVQIPPTVNISQVLDTVSQVGNELSTQPMRRMARAGVASATGLGRLAIVETAPRQPQIFASELLDRSTCGPCARIDNYRYASIAEMRLDYPAGIYIHCLGRSLCRGTPVFVWRSE